MIVYDDDGNPIPVGPEPPADDLEYDPGPEYDFEQDDDQGPPPLPPLSAEELDRAAEIHAAARRVHVAATRGSSASRVYTRLGGEFDPRGRHVGCDGEPGPAGGTVGGCGAAPGVACEHPRGRFVPGFVHPTRLAAERRMFGFDGLTPTTASV